MRDQKLVYTSEDGESKEIDIPSWLGEAPVNHHHLREAFALAMGAEGIDQETIAEIVQTVDDGQDEDASGIEELVTLTDRKIQIADPDDPETNVIIEPESAPSPDYHWDAMVLDYYHGRPVLCLYEPDKEDSQFTIALPTKDDPNIRPMTTRDIRLDKNVEIVEGDGEEP